LLISACASWLPLGLVSTFCDKAELG
jgi:hypothetical protein